MSDNTSIIRPINNVHFSLKGKNDVKIFESFVDWGIHPAARFSRFGAGHDTLW